VQAAEILLMMRPETEVPSDFQDYTLVTVVSVAAHLSGHELGDKVRGPCMPGFWPLCSVRGFRCEGSFGVAGCHRPASRMYWKPAMCSRKA